MSDLTSTSLALITCGILFQFPAFNRSWLKLGNSLNIFFKLPANDSMLFVMKIFGIFSIVIGVSGLLIGRN